MAFKTLLRQLISKWGVMSIEMQEAYQKDMAVIKEDNSYEYVDNPNDTQLHININATEQTQVEVLEEQEETTTNNPFEAVLEG